MTLIISVAYKDFVLVLGDRRQTHIENEDIYFDDMNKIFQVNDKVLLGYAGDVWVIDYLKSVLTVTSKETVQSVARKIRKIIRSIKKDMYFTVHIAGVSDSGKNELILITHRDGFKLNRIVVPNDEIRWLVSGPNIDAESMFAERYENLNEVNIDTIRSLAIQINQEVAEKDKTVSATCDVLHIKNN